MRTPNCCSLWAAVTTLQTIIVSCDASTTRWNDGSKTPDVDEQTGSRIPGAGSEAESRTASVLWTGSGIVPGAGSANNNNNGVSSSTSRQCRSNDECGDPELGQSCYWLYDGCVTGRCMCDPRRHHQDIEGRCRPLRVENEICSVELDSCQGGMRCVDDRCRCPESSRLTDDGQYCLRPNERLLGQKCSPSFDICLHKSANVYTRYDVYCSVTTGHCSCVDGYKQDGVSCRKWNIDERGCRRSIHCEGGALCVEGRCACPATHVAIASNTKCAMRGAVTDLPSGAICDEINETRYCARSLVCLRCPDDHVYKCVRFLMTSDYAFLWSGASKPSTSNLHIRLPGILMSTSILLPVAMFIIQLITITTTSPSLLLLLLR